MGLSLRLQTLLLQSSSSCPRLVWTTSRRRCAATGTSSAASTPHKAASAFPALSLPTTRWTSSLATRRLTTPAWRWRGVLMGTCSIRASVPCKCWTATPTRPVRAQSGAARASFSPTRAPPWRTPPSHAHPCRPTPPPVSYSSRCCASIPATAVPRGSRTVCPAGGTTASRLLLARGVCLAGTRRRACAATSPTLPAPAPQKFRAAPCQT